VLKGSSFKWTPKANSAFEEVKTKLTEVAVLACDASSVGIEGVLAQEGRPLAFFSEKLCDSRR